MTRFFENINPRYELFEHDIYGSSMTSVPMYVDVGGMGVRSVVITLLNDIDKFSLEKYQILKPIFDAYFENKPITKERWLFLSKSQQFGLIDELTVALSNMVFTEISQNPLAYSELFLATDRDNWQDLIKKLYASADLNCIAALARILSIQINVEVVKSPDDIYLLYQYGKGSYSKYHVCLKMQSENYFTPEVTCQHLVSLLKSKEWEPLIYTPNLFNCDYNLMELQRRVMQAYESMSLKVAHTCSGINAMMLAGELTLKDFKAIYLKGLDEWSNSTGAIDWGLQYFIERIVQNMRFKILAGLEQTDEIQLAKRFILPIVKFIYLINPSLIDEYLDERSVLRV